jgi:type IX secretion system substrate protein
LSGFDVSRALIRNVPGSYATIQSAINASVNGDTILVEPGTYTENINFRGKRVILTSRYYLNLDPSYINTTIINGSNPSNPDTASCVIINSGEDSTTVLQGFTITGGTGTKWLDEHGAGLYREGGGIIIQFSSPVIQDNIIINNEAINTAGTSGAGGGGIRIGDSRPKILNNVIILNRGRYGSGVVLNYTGCLLKNNIIAQNSMAESFGSGGGLWISGNFAAPKIAENNTIVNNSSVTGTGGIYIVNPTTFRNNIIYGNTGTQISGSGASVTYCDVQGGYTGTGNINVNPMFSDTNYVLMNASQCIDAGDTSSVYNDLPDPGNPGFAKYPSKGTLRNDIGAYGGPGTRILSGSLIGIEPIGSLVPNSFRLYQNYPNPFNPGTKIRFDMKTNSNAFLRIYDIVGHEVETLLNGPLRAGTYEIEWNASGYSSGIYYYKLISENFSETRKMILLK